jgi:hypothetical protein
MGRNISYGRLDPVQSRTDPSHVRESRHQADGSVSAHPQISNIVEKDHSCRGLWINGFAEKRSDNNLGAPRFTNYAAPEIVELTPQKAQPLRHISCSEIRTTGNDNSRRFAFGMGINYLNRSLQRHGLIVIHIVYYFGYII